MGPTERNSGNCNCDTEMFRGFGTAPIPASSPVSIVPPIFSFIPVFRRHLALSALECQACGTPVVGIRGSYMDNVICHEQESWALENTPMRWQMRSRTAAQEIIGYGQERCTRCAESLQLAPCVRRTVLHLSRGSLKISPILNAER